MRSEERATVQGPVKKQQLNGMSYRGVSPASSKGTRITDGGGYEDDGSTSDGCSSDGSASDGPESVRSIGSDSVRSVPEGRVINSDGEVVEEGDCPTADDDSEMDSDSQVVWAKSGQGNWRIGHTFGDKLYLPGTSCRTSGSPKSWWHQQCPNLHPNVESSQRQSRLRLARSALRILLICIISICVCQRVSKSLWQPTASK